MGSRRRLGLAAALAALVVVGAAGIAAGGAAAKPSAGDGKGGVKLTKLARFNTPIYVDDAPGSKELLFVVERAGKVRVLRRGEKLGRPFLNITDLVECCDGERGLLSIAFAPDYKRSKRFYVFYTAKGGEVNRVDEFQRAGRTTADRGSRRTVIELPHPNSAIHHGGQLQFGPDGYLYVSTGDGGEYGDPDNNAQNPDSPLGKLLRIDPTGGGADPYGIPPNNPFVGGPGLDEVYALGLRNPWRFSFDGKKDRIAIADVGEGIWEEVNYGTVAETSGANFGWDAFEGTQRNYLSTPVPPNPVFPTHQYRTERPGTCAIVGGYVVRDPKLKSLYGRYLYADLCAGELRSFVPNLDGATKDRRLGPSVASPTSFGAGSKGRIYVASYEGPLYRLAAK